MNCRCGQRCCTSLLYAAREKAGPKIGSSRSPGALGGTRTPNLLIRSYRHAPPD
jgi:hypothetical protein